MHTRRTLLASAGATVATVLVAGCVDTAGDDPAGSDDPEGGQSSDDADPPTDAQDDPEQDGDEALEDAGLSAFELVDRDADDGAAYVHGDHWHGSLPPVEVDHTLSVGAEIADEEGDPVALGEDEPYELRARVDDGAPEDVVAFDFHGDHVHVQGVAEGVTDVVFQLWHDDHADFETPPIMVQVVEDDDHYDDDHHEDDHHDDDHHDDDHDHHDAHVDELEIVDRSTAEVVADTHDDHWHGELPTIPLEDNVSLGARFLDEDGHEIPIGDDEGHEFRVRLADGATEGIVSFDFHGDHVHLIGDSTGETAVVFQLWHDDHADWESPPIDAVVEEDS